MLSPSVPNHLVLKTGRGDATAEHRLAFPLISSKDVSRLVARLEDDDENSIILDFVAWLRKKLKKPSSLPQGAVGTNHPKPSILIPEHENAPHAASPQFS